MARKQSKGRKSYLLLSTAIIAFLVCAGLYFYQANTIYNRTNDEIHTDVVKLRNASDGMLGELKYDELNDNQRMQWQNYLYSIVPRNQIAIVMGAGKEVIFSTAGDIEELINSLTGEGGRVNYNGLSFVWTSIPSKDESVKYVLAMNDTSMGFLSQKNLPIVFLGSILLIIIGVNLVVIAGGKLKNLDDDSDYGMISDEENDYLYLHELASEDEMDNDIGADLIDDMEDTLETYVLPQAKPLVQKEYNTDIEDEAIKETMASAATVVNQELRNTKARRTVLPKERQTYTLASQQSKEPELVDINIEDLLPQKSEPQKTVTQESVIQKSVAQKSKAESEADAILSGIEAARQKSKESQAAVKEATAAAKATETKQTTSKAPAKAKSVKAAEEDVELDITLDSKAKRIPSEVKRMIKETKGHISLTECAEQLGVHHTYIWKVLKMVDDRSFQDYLEEYRLDEAKRMLLETNMTVQQIADELGYTNAQNFIRFFSKVTGVTPGKFRKGIS